MGPVVGDSGSGPRLAAGLLPPLDEPAHLVLDEEEEVPHVSQSGAGGGRFVADRQHALLHHVGDPLVEPAADTADAYQDDIGAL